ncbi:MAG: hypothetical protein DI570_29215 [Phenylobacterium zucineum]|nr:MAG: hypothetical protein DI570_29215 [Phenylobacterium zucineum]
MSARLPDSQATALADMIALGATSEATARPVTANSNTLNRLYSRGAAGRTADKRRWWVTPDGVTALAKHQASSSPQRERISA